MAEQRIASQNGAPSARVYRIFWIVVGGALVAGSVASARELLMNPNLLVWLGALVTVQLFPIPTWKGANYAVDEPVLIALALTNPPTVTAAVAFVGGFDLRELRGQITITRALFTRSQVAIAAYAASAVFHFLADLESNDLPRLIAASLVAMTVLSGLNVLLVAGTLRTRGSDSLLRVVSELLTGAPVQWGIGYLSFSLLGLLIALLAAGVAGAWAALLGTVPLMLLGRGALLHVRSARREAELAREREGITAAAAERAAAERRDERAQLAAALHDEAIPLLEAINLLTNVAGTREDAARVLEEIRQTSQRGAATLRGIVGDLRRSEFSPGGIEDALQRLVEVELKTSRANVALDVDALEIPAGAELTIYQVAREALCNAMKHADATRIAVSIKSRGSSIELRVADDGCGFHPDISVPGHFGLQLMRERAAAVGATLSVESGVGGTEIRFLLPLRERPSQQTASASV